MAERVQTNLTVGPADDVYEREADRVAAQVRRMPESGATEDVNSLSASDIRRLPTGDGGQPLPPDFQPGQSGGRPLSSATRQFMEPRFGLNFDHVRLHTDERAQRSATQIQARAFTYGNHITLGEGASESDQRLMAHELTHVVQQDAVNAQPQQSGTVNRLLANRLIQRDPPPPGPTPPATPTGRLPCTSGTTIDIYAVNLPGSTGSINTDVTNANSILCQCGIELNVAGGESWSTNLMDRDPPIGVLNEFTSVGSPTDEEVELLGHQPGGSVQHVYYVPSLSSGSLAESFPASEFPTAFNNAVVLSNSASTHALANIALAHELGHVLLNDGSHHPDRDNLMADGSINSGAGELEELQCGRM